MTRLDHMVLHFGHLCTREETLPEHKHETIGLYRPTCKVKSLPQHSTGQSTSQSQSFNKTAMRYAVSHLNKTLTGTLCDGFEKGPQVC